MEPEDNAAAAPDPSGEQRQDTDRAREVVRRRAESGSRRRTEIREAREKVRRQERQEAAARGDRASEDHNRGAEVHPDGRDRTTEHAAPPPSTEEHEADAKRIKERMIRAGQVRRQRDKVQVAEVDPVLPDWYEPSLSEDDEEDEPPASQRSALP